MFKRLIFYVVIFLIFICIPAYAAENRRIIETIASSDSVTAISVPSANTIYTKSFSLDNSLTSETGDNLGVMFKASSSGTITLKLELEQGYIRPATEGASSAYFLITDVVKSSITNTDWYMATIDSIIMPYARFKITGSGSNAASTTIQIKVAK